jgi:Domain of unknown function (DUF4381)
VNEVSPKGLVPPRPNLGTEPWPSEPPIVLYLSTAGLVIALAIVGLFLWRLRRRRSRTAPRSLPTAIAPDASPRGQMVALSASLRDALTHQFGTSWRAKTTEELATDSRLEELLGIDELKELSRFLDHVDQLKFAPERANHRGDSLEADLATWTPRVATFRSKIQTRR